MEKEIVLYRTFDSPVEANIVKDVLETNGVPCFLSNEIFSSVLPLTNSEVGAIRLNVFAAVSYTHLTLPTILRV